MAVVYDAMLGSASLDDVGVGNLDEAYNNPSQTTAC